MHAFSSILVKRWEAHSTSINKLIKLKEPGSSNFQGYISCSLDKSFKIWSPAGDLFAAVNLSKFGSTLWKFPYDWVGVKLSEIEFVFKIQKFIEEHEIDD